MVGLARGVVFLLLLGACASRGSSPALAPDLFVPETIDQHPSPGLRVRQFDAEFVGTGVYHTLYLPEDWRPARRYPVVVEYPGNRYRGGAGTVESCKLGYGLSGGRGVIWICLPFVDSARQVHATSWWGDVAATVAYCKRAVLRVCRDFGGDPGELFLAGFSRGAIACNFIGLHDDEIAGLWRGFICHSHYEGVRSWPESTPAGAAERLARLGQRPQFISHEQSVAETQSYLARKKPGGAFTFLALPFPEHTGGWVLRDSAARRALRRWFAEELARP